MTKQQVLLYFLLVAGGYFAGFLTCAVLVIAKRSDENQER